MESISGGGVRSVDTEDGMWVASVAVGTRPTRAR